MSKRVVTYARVSAEDQAKHGYSLPSQIESCPKYAEDRGWLVVAEVSDNGISGAALDRPGLDNIRDMAQAGQTEEAIIQEIAGRLIALPFKTRQGNTEWQAGTVSLILGSETYTGTKRYNRRKRQNPTKTVLRPEEEWIATLVPRIVEGRPSKSLNACGPAIAR